MNCCGDHVVWIPRPDELILFASSSDTLAYSSWDAQARIWSNRLNHNIFYRAIVTYKWSFLFNEGFDQLVYVFWYGRPTDRAKWNLSIRSSSRSRKKNKKKILQRIPIVLHVVPASPREMSQYQYLPLHGSEFWYRNQQVEEVQEHKLPYVCPRPTVSLRPRKQFRRCRR